MYESYVVMTILDKENVPLIDFTGVKTFNANLFYIRYISSLASEDISSAIINDAFAVYSGF